MKIDEYGTVGYTEEELLEHIKRNPDFDLTGIHVLDSQGYDKGKKDTYLNVPEISNWESRSYDLTVEDYHKELQKFWILPDEYSNIDVAKFIRSKCQTQEELNRVNSELELYEECGMINLLRYLKYIRDTADKHGIVFGVGRGSSCASYCLFLLKIHRVDSLKYDLDIKEFLRK